MKIVHINATCGVGSTGKICLDISRLLIARGDESYILYSSSTNGYEHGIGCSSNNYIKTQAFKSRLLGNYGFNSKRATRKMISELDRIKPDIVHLHNIHGHDCNLEMLFTYFKEKGIRLVWTCHDCWPFTAYCTHFAMAKCDKWKSGCKDCVQKKSYSWFLDRSSRLYKQKKKLFTGLDMTLVAPSQWVADLTKQSFLGEYPVEVINNGIDLNVFYPVEGNFKQKYGIGDKKLILGVSFDWTEKKGVDVFIELAKKLPDDYKIVLVGTNDSVDRILPDNIISIHRTQDQKELAEIYTAADLFVNPTREEVLGLVNIEALACGTPGVTFNSGGSPECYNETCGAVVECGDVDALEKEIIRICTDMPYLSEDCINNAKKFDKDERYKEYLNLYERINSSGAQGGRVRNT